MKKALNLTVLSKTYGEGYVARIVNSNKILAHAKSADKVIEKIKNSKEFKQKKVVISWVPKYGARYVFGISFFLRRS